MASAIIKPSTYDATLVQFDEVKKNAKGGKSVKVSYNDEKKFYIRTPEMSVGFDLVVEESKDLGAGIKSLPKYSFQVSFKGMGTDDANGRALKSFHEMIDQLDELLIEKGIENSASWLGKKTITRDSIDYLVKRTIKQSKDKITQEPDGKYPDTMKIRIPVNKEGKLMCEFYDKDGTLVSDIGILQKLKKGARISMILECAGIYFASGNFGFAGWQIFQCMIKQEASSGSTGIPRGVCLITDSDDEDESPTVARTIDTKKVSSSVHQPLTVDDEEEEEEEEVAREPTPPPPVVEEPKKVVKKVVVRKK